MVSKVIRMSVTGFTRLPCRVPFFKRMWGNHPGFSFSRDRKDPGTGCFIYIQSDFNGPFNRIRFVNTQFLEKRSIRKAITMHRIQWESIDSKLHQWMLECTVLNILCILYKKLNGFLYVFCGLEFVDHSFAYVAHFVFLRDVWIEACDQLRHPSPNLAINLHCKCWFYKIQICGTG